MYHPHLSTLLLKSLKETLKDIPHIINILTKTWFIIFNPNNHQSGLWAQT